jgi:hypothetical protein
MGTPAVERPCVVDRRSPSSVTSMFTPLRRVNICVRNRTELNSTHDLWGGSRDFLFDFETSLNYSVRWPPESAPMAASAASTPISGPLVAAAPVVAAEITNAAPVADDPDELWAQWKTLNDDCRGGSPGQATDLACAERDEVIERQAVASADASSRPGVPGARRGCPGCRRRPPLTLSVGRWLRACCSPRLPIRGSRTPTIWSGPARSRPASVPRGPTLCRVGRRLPAGMARSELRARRGLTSRFGNAVLPVRYVAPTRSDLLLVGVRASN